MTEESVLDPEEGAGHSKPDLVYRGVRNQLAEGAYEPGDRLVIDSIAVEFEVSAVPVREAIRRLEAEGWVTYKPHVGAVVAGVSPEEWRNALELLAVLEGRATALAAPRLTEADLSTLHDLDRSMERSLEQNDLSEFGTLNTQFHRVFHHNCGNRWLPAMLLEAESKQRGLTPWLYTLLPGRAKQSSFEHEQILIAIERNADADVIEELARRHKMDTVIAYDAQKAGGGDSSAT